MTAKRTQSQIHAKIVPLRPPTGPTRLAGKVAVVTGASRGIGYAIARALAVEGANVVISARELPSLTKSAARLRKEVIGPAKILAIPSDIREAQSVAGMFAVVKKRFGQVDVLVNNAGIMPPVATVEQTSFDTWRNVVDTNLTGLFLCTRAALPLMKEGATIINNLSAAARQVFPNCAAYGAAKRGALGFTLSLREELIPRGIRVMALMTGATDTELWNQIMPNAPRHRMIDVNSVAQAVLYAVLLPPNVNPTEISLDPAGGAL